MENISLWLYRSVVDMCEVCRLYVGPRSTE